MLKESLLVAALSFPSWHGDQESLDARSTRLDTIAEAIATASERATCTSSTASEKKENQPRCVRTWSGSARELGFLLLTQAFFETRLALHVHEGKCRADLGECDGGKAISLWQLQYGGHLPKDRWAKMAGTSLEATTLAASEAARALGRGRNYCGNVPGAISLYATGRTCRWEPSRKRHGFLKKLLNRY